MTGRGCLTAAAWAAFGCAVLLSGCVTISGHNFAYQVTNAPTPPTVWRLECTYVALAASILCLAPAFALLLRKHPGGLLWAALLLACGSMTASLIGWLLPVLASALG